MPTNKVANRDCRVCVQQRKPFMGSNLTGVQTIVPVSEAGNSVYVVYSYGSHYPMFIHSNGLWFENSDKSSPSTERQRSQARPVPTSETIKLDTTKMGQLSIIGYTALAQLRVQGR